MEPFKFIRVQDDQSAIRAALLNNSKFIAGGTNILDLMKLNIETPKQVIDINRLPLKQNRRTTQRKYTHWCIG